MKYHILLLLSLTGIHISAQHILSLGECRNMAMEYNKSLQMTQLDVKKALANQKEARTAYMPAFKASGSASLYPLMDDISIPGFHLPTADANGTVTGESDVYFPGLTLNTDMLQMYQAQLSMTVPIYAGGQVRYANKMADKGVDIAHHSLQLQIDNVIQTIEQAYWQIVSLESNILVAQKYATMLDSLENQLIDMHQLGLAPKSEQLKVSVQKNDADLSLLRANNALQILKMRLCQLVGLPINTSIELSDRLNDNIQMPDVTNAWIYACENRHDMKILENQVEIANLKCKTTSAAYMPSIGAQMSHSYIVVPNLIDGRWNSTAAAQISIPVFHWREKKHKLSSVQLEKQKTQLHYEDSKQSMQLEVQQYILKLNEGLQATLLAQKACLEAMESLDEVKASYDVGLNTTTDLLNAQAAWQKAEANRIQTLVEFELAKTAYHKSIGMLNYSK
ncbi:MAG: TolC family protein [Breznakibacter sp.]